MHYAGHPAATAHRMWSGQLLYALGQCMIRHTKRQQLGGEEVLNLPPLHQEDVAGEADTLD